MVPAGAYIDTVVQQRDIENRAVQRRLPSDPNLIASLENIAAVKQADPAKKNPGIKKSSQYEYVRYESSYGTKITPKKQNYRKAPFSIRSSIRRCLSSRTTLCLTRRLLTAGRTEQMQ